MEGLAFSATRAPLAPSLGARTAPAVKAHGQAQAQAQARSQAQVPRAPRNCPSERLAVWAVAIPSGSTLKRCARRLLAQAYCRAHSQKKRPPGVVATPLARRHSAVSAGQWELQQPQVQSVALVGDRQWPQPNLGLALSWCCS